MLSRRSFLGAGARGTVMLVGGQLAVDRLFGAASARALPFVAPRQTPLDAAVREFTLEASLGTWDAGTGRAVRVLSYNGRVPGPELRVKVGDVVRVTLVNRLPEPTTIHWHGIPVPFEMDGVPELTQPAVQPGQRFTYEFTATIPGTYWYHSHLAYQFERGLFGALVVEPQREPLAYDREYTLVVDDWLHDTERPVASAMPYNMIVGGTMMGAPEMMMNHEDRSGTATADGALANQNIRAGHSPAHGAPMREPVFDAYTINGQLGRAHPVLDVRTGDRLRLRLINASTATVFPLYLAGHRLTVTHTDGQATTPYETDVIALGMGERIDVVVDANNPGAWTLASSDPRQRAKGLELILRYSGVRPETRPSDQPVPKLDGRPYRRMEGAADREPTTGDPARSYSLALRMADETTWTINGKTYPDVPPLEVTRGERVRLRIRNNSMFAHPMHLHGHFFDVVRPYGAAADVRRPLRKDTLTLYHMDEHVLEFMADNPGARWFLHCHNQYHHVGGMATEVRYV